MIQLIHNGIATVPIVTGRPVMARSRCTKVAVAKTPDHGEDILGSAKMDALIAQLRERFDMVIIDTPPVLALAESRLVAAKTDGVVFVVRWRKTPAKAAELGLGALADSGVKVLGVTLSQVDFDRQRAFGYGDGSYYYSNYRDYYAK